MKMQQLSNTSGAVAQRIAGLLGTRVSIIDQYGLEIAFEESGSRRERDYMRVDSGAPYVITRVLLENEPVRVLVGEPSGSHPVSREVVQRLIMVVAEQYAEPARHDEGQEARNALISRLVFADGQDEKALVREARRLKVDLNSRRCVVLVNMGLHTGNGASAGGNGVDGEHLAWPVDLVLDTISDFFGQQDDTMCGYLAHGLFVILKGTNADNMVQWIRSGELHRYGENWVNLQVAKAAGRAVLAYLKNELGIRAHVAVGRQYTGISGLALSYKDAQTAMRVGLSLPGSYGDEVFSLDDLGFDTLAWIREPSLKLEFARQLLAPLDSDTELLKTLQVFFEENCSPAVTSQRLSLHRNSLYYRLDKIAGLIGLDPRKIDHAAMMRLAMHVDQARRADMEWQTLVGIHAPTAQALQYSGNELA